MLARFVLTCLLGVSSIQALASAPGDAWRVIEKLRKDFAQMEQKIQAGAGGQLLIEQKTNQLALMQQHLEHFIRQYGTDSRVLRARAWWVEVAPQVAEGLGVRLDRERWNSEIELLEASPDAPLAMRGEIEAAIINARLRDWSGGITERSSLEPLLERIERFLVRHKNDERAPVFAFLLGSVVQKEDEARAARAYTIAANSMNSSVASRAETAKAILPYFHRPLDLAFTASDGRKVDLAEYRGKIVILDFWATWCGPCVADMPKMVALHRDFHSRGLEIIGISLDQNRSKLEDYVAKNGIPWPHYFDGGGWNTKVSRRFAIGSIPAVWVIGRDGRVIEAEARRNLRELVAHLLAPPRKA